MNVTDVQIGDWVLSKSMCAPCKVVGIDPMEEPGREGYSFKLKGPNNILLFVRAVSVEPIPLTPEILEKNGFVPATNGVSWYLRDDDTDECLLVLNKIHNAFVMSTAGMTIGFQYVHQLQHLLRLCGITHIIET